MRPRVGENQLQQPATANAMTNRRWLAWHRHRHLHCLSSPTTHLQLLCRSVLLAPNWNGRDLSSCVNGSVARKVVNGPVKMARPTDRLTI
jgi:hypothetical protein